MLKVVEAARTWKLRVPADPLAQSFALWVTVGSVTQFLNADSCSCKTPRNSPNGSL